MSQAPIVINDGTGVQVLDAMNNAFNTLATNFSGTAAPSTTYAGMLWEDTQNKQLKLRNEANTGWQVIGTYDGTKFVSAYADKATTKAYTDKSDSVATTQFVSDVVAGTGAGYKNRIINGAMMIDQRNAGASVTASNGSYTLDRWSSYSSVASKFSVQQNAGSVAPPSGFANYLGATSLSAYTVGAAENFGLYQIIEGFNIADFGWGTAKAVSVTLSFWVRSSLTGTFGGSLTNSATDRSYPFSYTISSANTWEQKYINIAGDTSGTWLTNNGTGIRLSFGLGIGSTYSAVAGAWASGNYVSATGATSVVGTNGATFYITGVQLEKGSTATSFDYRPYGTELMLCQRYYSTGGTAWQGYALSANQPGIASNYPVSMRTMPTVAVSNAMYSSMASATVSANTTYLMAYATASVTGMCAFSITWTANAEL